MSDSETIEKIQKMSVFELLEHVIASPENLTDSYYRDFGAAIRERFTILRDRFTVFSSRRVK